MFFVGAKSNYLALTRNSHSALNVNRSLNNLNQPLRFSMPTKLFKLYCVPESIYNYLYLCTLIFSNVVEKCVTHASRAERAMLIDEVCSSNDRCATCVFVVPIESCYQYFSIECLNWSNADNKTNSSNICHCHGLWQKSRLRLRICRAVSF